VTDARIALAALYKRCPLPVHRQALVDGPPSAVLYTKAPTVKLKVSVGMLVFETIIVCLSSCRTCNCLPACDLAPKTLHGAHTGADIDLCGPR
jgi:hypothetical protein